MTRRPPVCILCKERCGQFLCPCCGMHNEMPWKCDICQPHTEPCMTVLLLDPVEEKGKPWIGCLILLASALVAVLAIIGAIAVIRAVVT